MGEQRLEPREQLLKLSALLSEHPFSGEYIRMCREHKLARIFIAGDWYIIFDGETTKGPKVWGPGRHAYHTLESDGVEIVWLPRLDQLYNAIHKNQEYRSQEYSEEAALRYLLTIV